jgi:hypothetical protein
MERLILDRDLRIAMSHAARLRAQERSWDAVNAVLVREYQNIAGKRPEPVRRWA